MTTLPSTIPSSISTVEEMVLWCTLILSETAYSETIYERQGVLSNYVDYLYTRSQVGTPIAICRIIVPLSETSGLAPSAKPWNLAQEIVGSTAPPAYYATN
jgi:hypothetical protein